MTNKISKRFKISFDIVKKGEVVNSMVQTVCADTEEQAEASFDQETIERSKHRSGTRKVTNVELLSSNPIYTQHNDFFNRYGVDPVQYENE